jgi:hypothetical protein
MFEDAFASLGAKPVQVNILQLYRSLADGGVDGQETRRRDRITELAMSKFISCLPHWSVQLLAARSWRLLLEIFRISLAR